MSALSETIEIVFGASGVGNVTSAVGKVNASLQSIADKAKQMANISLGFAAGVTVIGGVLAKEALDAAMDFEEAMSEVAKVLSEHEEQLLPQMRGEILKMSGVYGVAATNVARSAADFKQAGFSVKDALLLTENNLKLVKTGAVSAEEGTTILIRILKGFKLPAEESEHLLDILNTVTAKFATNIPDLSEALARSAGTARSAGLTVAETVSILTPILEVFQNSEAAATAFNSTMLNLTSDTKAVTGALEAMGVAQKININGVETLRGSKEILADVVAKFGGLTSNQQLYVAGLLAGKDHAAKMVEVFAGLKTSAGVLKEVEGALGRTAVEVKISLDTSLVAVERFKNSWTNIMIAVGDASLKEVKGIVNGMTEIENALADVIGNGGLDPLFDLLNPQLEQIEILFRGVAKALPDAFKNIDFSSLSGGLGELGTTMKNAFKGVFGDLDLTKVEDLHKALQMFFDGLGGFSRILSGQLEFWQPLWDAIGGGASAFGKVDDASLKTVGKVLEAGRALANFGSILGGAVVALSTAADNFGRAHDRVVTWIVDGVIDVEKAFNEMFLFIKEAELSVAETMSELPTAFGGDDWAKEADTLKEEIVELKKKINENFDEMATSADGFWDSTTGLGASAEPAKIVLDEVDKKQTGIFEKRKSELAALAGDSNATRAKDKAEEKLAEAKREVISSGKMIELKIDGSALSAPLTEILDVIVAAIQVRATEEGAEMLVGCG